MVPEAVRRGRKIKCRECGLKGATLGCLNRFCRSSFHLSCARDSGCELLVSCSVNDLLGAASATVERPAVLVLLRRQLDGRGRARSSVQ
jgi:hypothetical protein